MFKPSNIEQLTPYFTVSDCEKSEAFYRDAFGFVVVDFARDEQGTPLHVLMKKQNVTIMFSPEGAHGSTKKTPNNLGISLPVNMYVYCENVDILYKQAMDNGARSAMEPQDSFWGDRFCAMMDIDGYEWWFATLLKNASETR